MSGRVPIGTRDNEKVHSYAGEACRLGRMCPDTDVEGLDVTVTGTPFHEVPVTVAIGRSAVS